MYKRVKIEDDVEMLTAWHAAPAPALGGAAINTYVIKGKQPLVVDTGTALDGDAFMSALAEVIDPREIRWIWLTHEDADHMGGLEQILEMAPESKLVGNIETWARIGLHHQIANERYHFLPFGGQLDIGDTVLQAQRPPYFDSPSTMGCFDTRRQLYFSSDSFGMFTGRPAESMEEYTQEELISGMAGMAQGIAAWLPIVDRKLYQSGVQAIRALGAKKILSSHAAPITADHDKYFDIVMGLPDTQPEEFASWSNEQLHAFLHELDQGFAGS